MNTQCLDVDAVFYSSGVLNSAINPLIYALWYEHFRRSSAQLFRRGRVKLLLSLDNILQPTHSFI